MLNRISSSELSEWMAFYAIHPWGEERDDLRAGIVASTIANCNRAKNSKSFKPSDFMPKFQPQEAKQTIEEQQAIARMLHEMFKNKGKRVPK